MLTATITVNIDHQHAADLDHADRHALQDLPQIPDGAHLIVNVGDRRFLTPSAVGWLASHARRLHVEITANSPRAARHWYDAIKTGDLT